MTKEKLKKIETGIEKKKDTLEKLVNKNSVFLALGSNLSSDYGSKINNLEIAMLLLLSEKIKIVSKSSFYETLSFPNINNPKYVNCVIKINTKLKPKSLIKIILKIEKKIGRLRKIKNQPRVCDIDIIDYKGKIINSRSPSNLIIPHQFLHLRNFVLVPLFEISPNWIHPKSRININILLNKLTNKEFNYIKKIKNLRNKMI